MSTRRNKAAQGSLTAVQRYIQQDWAPGLTYRDSITHQVHAECKSNPQMDPVRYRAQCPLPHLISHQSVSEPAVIHVHQGLISLCSHMPSAPQKLPQQPTNESPCHSSQADSTSGGSRRRPRQGEGGHQNWSRNVWISVPTGRVFAFTQLFKRDWKLFFWISSGLQLPSCIWTSAFPKRDRHGTEQKAAASVHSLLQSWEQVKCRNKGGSLRCWEQPLCIVVVVISLR